MTFGFQVSNHGYFYAWMRDTLIPGVFAGPWYNDELVKYPGFIDNHESFLVSIPRIRQVRVQKGMPKLTVDVVIKFPGGYLGKRRV